MFGVIGKLRPQIKYKFWAGVGHEGQTLEDLKRVTLEVGNEILEVDEDNQRILVGAWEETGEDVWGCRICLAEGTIVIVDTERELIAHCDVEHPGWWNNGG